MTKYLVVGASGCLGTALVEELGCQNFEYVIAGRSNLQKNAYFHFLDLTDLDSVSTFPIEDFDQIFYLAQSRKFKHYPEGIEDMYKVNFQAPRALALRANEIGIPFIYVSTGSVYKSKLSAMNETDEFQPNGSLSLYQITKLASEFEFRQFTNVKVVRPFFIYGKNSDNSSLIPTIVNKVREGRSIQLNGKMGILINPVHSADAARALIHITDKNDRVFNIAGIENINLFDLGGLISNLLGTKPKFEVVEGADCAILGNTRLLLETGFVYRFTLESGLRDYIGSGVFP